MPEPVYDVKGREIREGDLLRSPHFRDSKRRKYYLWHMAAVDELRLLGIPVHELVPGRDRGGRFWLTQQNLDRYQCEIVHATDGYFNRPRRVTVEVKDGLEIEIDGGEIEFDPGELKIVNKTSKDDHAYGNTGDDE